MWSQEKWASIQDRVDAEERIPGDPFNDTRLALKAANLPPIVHAVAAYPSKEAWQDDTQPHESRPDDITAMEALVQLPRPLLVARPDIDELEALRRTVDVAIDPEFRLARDRYYEWFRDLIEPLRDDGNKTLAETHLDEGSLDIAKSQLNELWLQERAILERDQRREWLTRFEVACMTAGTAGTVGLAAAAALPAVGIPVALLTFAGWAFTRWNTPSEPRSLTGATMFVHTQRQLDWLEDPST